MLKPSEYIAAAVRRIQEHSLSENALQMACGGPAATVTRAASFQRGESDVSGDDPAERFRVLALVSDFPMITKGDVATIGEKSYMVTSVRVDCTKSSQYVGLSGILGRYQAMLFGVRGSRKLCFPIDILAVNNGLAPDITDGYAPTTVHSWTLCIAVDSWPDNGQPQIGDEVRFEKDGAEFRVKVARCDLRERHYVVSARSR